MTKRLAFWQYGQQNLSSTNERETFVSYINETFVCDVGFDILNVKMNDSSRRAWSQARHLGDMHVGVHHCDVENFRGDVTSLCSRKLSQYLVRKDHVMRVSRQFSKQVKLVVVVILPSKFVGCFFICSVLVAEVTCVLLEQSQLLFVSPGLCSSCTWTCSHVCSKCETDSWCVLRLRHACLVHGKWGGDGTAGRGGLPGEWGKDVFCSLILPRCRIQKSTQS